MLSFCISNRLQHPTRALKQFLRLVTTSLMLAFMALPLLAQTPAPKPATKMTDKDRELAINNLKATREKFVASVAGLSEAQLKFKSAPDRWSIAEVAEHITEAEAFLMNILTEKVLKTPAAPDKERKVTDEQVIAMITDRSTKAQAPEPLKPTGRWPTNADTMKEFEKRRANTIEFVKTTPIDLRSYFTNFGPRGEIDALQWVLFISSHSARHTAQINEVKADPNFPKQ